MAEGVGLIRSAQGFAPKPVALPCPTLGIRCANAALLRIARHLTFGQMAEGVGFEPTVSFHPRQFSRLEP